MKIRKILASVTVMAFLLSLSALGLTAAADDGTYTATLMGQLDAAVSDSVPEWGIGDIPEASVNFALGEQATISMTFDEPIKFTGNWTGISTDIPVTSDTEAMLVGGRILSFKVDGNDLGEKKVPLINRDDNGFLTIDIARQWGGDYDDYDLAGMEPFSSIEITFILGAKPFTATLMGQLDADVSDTVPEWGIGDIPDASVDFDYGDEVKISMQFDEPIKFTGNWTGISTDIPVIGDLDAESTGAIITSFIVDGVDLGSKAVPLINRDKGGFLAIDIARQWGGSYDDYDLAGMEPFSSLEITFTVPNAPEGIADPFEEFVPDPPAFSSGNAWIGGTFILEDGSNDWHEYDDQSVAFEVGVPFMVVLDLGDEKNTHLEADWGGYILVVQTDIDDNERSYDAFINAIRVDGRSIPFYGENIEMGFDRGIRIAITSMWAEEPVVVSHAMIGEFSKIEVEIAITAAGAEAPVFNLGGADAEAPVSNPGGAADSTAVSADGDDDSGGFPGWGIALIAVGGVAAVGGAIVVVNKKK